MKQNKKDTKAEVIILAKKELELLKGKLHKALIRHNKILKAWHKNQTELSIIVSEIYKQQRLLKKLNAKR